MVYSPDKFFLAEGTQQNIEPNFSRSDASFRSAVGFLGGLPDGALHSGRVKGMAVRLPAALVKRSG